MVQKAGGEWTSSCEAVCVCMCMVHDRMSVTKGASPNSFINVIVIGPGP